MCGGGISNAGLRGTSQSVSLDQKLQLSSSTPISTCQSANQTNFLKILYFPVTKALNLELIIIVHKFVFGTSQKFSKIAAHFFSAFHMEWDTLC